MIVGDDIPEFPACVDVHTIHVNAPTSVLFLCGGKTDLKDDDFLSLRDAFLHVSHRPEFKKYDIILAEELNSFFFSDGTYKDILNFEADIAQISDLIILFSESFGSAAELGAFSMVPEIAANMLVIMDDEHYTDQSFIKLGPIRSLESVYGDKSVCVLNRRDINIPSITKVQSLDIDVFTSSMNEAVRTRSEQVKGRSTFDRSKVGHLIKLIVCLIQHYGSLTLDEIEVCLYCMGVDIVRSRIIDLLICAEFVDWILKDKRGMNTFYSAKPGWSAPIEVVRPLVWLLSLEDGRHGQASEARGDRRQATAGGCADLAGPERLRRDPRPGREFSDVLPVAA